ncbi:rRNA maturation RNase YbeY [Silvibacterium acidisoli]|uniref:rRNA maturation RNase YbeY n=1 Tax=Acidobacteriaceae bacterium ZG23-2 TaxID=2883246 RepID=UPI00406C9688
MIQIDPDIRKLFPARLLGKQRMTDFLGNAIEAVKLNGDVSVLLTGDEEIRMLNRDFRKKDKATDVLSFPAAPIPGMPKSEQVAGDLAISLETAAREAQLRGHSLEHEVKVLLLHGALHLAGYDHETDDGQMARREAALRKKLGLEHGLIERTVAKTALKKITKPAKKTAAKKAKA